MKKIVLILMIIASGVMKGQDSLSIGNYQLGFNTQDDFFFEDSLQFSYTPTKTGDQGVEYIHTRVSVYNGSQWTQGLEDEVLVDTSESIIDYSLGTTVNNTVILRASAFNTGNNTVVIWPDSKLDPDYVSDSIKFVVGISGYLSTGPAPLLEKVKVVSASGRLSFTNKESKETVLSIHTLDGKLLNQVALQANASNNIAIPTGVYFITLREERGFYLHKVLVK